MISTEGPSFGRPTDMTLTTIIISYNTRDLLRNCLTSVYAQEAALASDVVVVDNASADDSVAMVTAEFPRVRVIANETNLGYAAAINQALRGLQSDYALILNSDIEIHPQAVERLLSFMESNPQAGMVAPQLILPDGSVQPTWRRGFSLWQFAAQQLMFDKLQRRAGAAPSEGPVEHLDGAALLLRAAALKQVGLMDEAYWMYCEDSDWCLRFRRAGWTLHYLPHATMLHHHGASSKHVRAEMIASYNLAAARYFRLHEGPLEGLLARWLGVSGTSLRFLGAMLGAIVTVGLYAPLTSRAKLFTRALVLQAKWRGRWLRGECVPGGAEL